MDRRTVLTIALATALLGALWLAIASLVGLAVLGLMLAYGDGGDDCGLRQYVAEVDRLQERRRRQAGGGDQRGQNHKGAEIEQGEPHCKAARRRSPPDPILTRVFRHRHRRILHGVLSIKSLTGQIVKPFFIF